MYTLIQNGYVVDPASDREGYLDILIKDDRIVEVAPKTHIHEEEVDQIIDASGKYILPGFIDLHVHLREPGYEYKETIESGTMAAAAGGFTTICPMPNTKPATDSPMMVNRVLRIAKETGKVNVLPIAAITLDQDGNQLADIDGIIKAGAVGISEDGKSVMDTYIYHKAMKEAAKLDIPVFAHCEDKDLVQNGVINQGAKGKELKLAEISNAVEDIITARDIFLAKDTGARLHLCHISTKDSIRMLELAKKDGVKVTGEVCPHHFILCDEDIPKDDANYKMNPPLRSKQDVEAIIEGLKSGVVDVIATDHAPHSVEEKQRGFATAPFGIVGLETAFSLSYSNLVLKDILNLKQLVEKMSWNPAKILNIPKGTLGEGAIADITIVDLENEYEIQVDQFFSKGVNTPFGGYRVRGRVEYTLVNGNIVYMMEDEYDKPIS